VAKIKNRDFKKVSFKRSPIEFFDHDGKKLFAVTGSEATRETLLVTIREYNKIDTIAMINYSLEPTSSGSGRFVSMNRALYFGMWF
jgi:hypothetical protein